MQGYRLLCPWLARPAYGFSTACMSVCCLRLAKHLGNGVADRMQKPMQGQRLAQQRSGTGGQKHAELACGSRSGWTSRAAATGRWAAGQAPGASLWRSLQSSRHPACGATMRVRHHPKDHAWSAEASKRCLPHTNCVSPATARTPAGWRALLNPQQTECTCIAQKAMLHTSLAGDKIVELVAWLEKGGISTEEELLEALSAAPLPRKGAQPAAKPAPAAGADQASSGVLIAAMSLRCYRLLSWLICSNAWGHGTACCPARQMLQSCADVMCLQMQLNSHCLAALL